MSTCCWCLVNENARGAGIIRTCGQPIGLANASSRVTWNNQVSCPEHDGRCRTRRNGTLESSPASTGSAVSVRISLSENPAWKKFHVEVAIDVAARGELPAFASCLDSPIRRTRRPT